MLHNLHFNIRRLQQAYAFRMEPIHVIEEVCRRIGE